jgi:dihydrolipoamide dehydrogenase
MKEFELVVIGGGTANNVAAAAAEEGIDTALIEKGKLGGTCLNRGCNPSKMLIQAANVSETVRGSERFGVDSSIEGIDYSGIVEEMDTKLSGIAEDMEEVYLGKENLTLYNDEASFVNDRTVEIEGVDEEVYGDKVVVAAGSGPLVPPIDGLEKTDYLTSNEALYLDEAPDSLVVLGGGYISCELGYFFDAMGTDVRIVEANDTLLHREDADVAEAFHGIASERHEVHTGYIGTSVSETPEGVEITAEATDGGDEITVSGERLLVAAGRKPNTEALNLGSTGVETDESDFIKTNERLETTAEGIWAQGDIADNFMFKHSGDYETECIIRNVVYGEGVEVDYTAMPHAIFTEPQIAGVGATEDELRSEGAEYEVGRARFAESAMGRAKKLEDGFVKVLASPDGEILGCQMIGEEASVMLHEVVVAMRNGLTVGDIVDTIHVHPTLNRIVESAFKDVRR